MFHVAFSGKKKKHFFFATLSWHENNNLRRWYLEQELAVNLCFPDLCATPTNHTVNSDYWYKSGPFMHPLIDSVQIQPNITHVTKL